MSERVEVAEVRGKLPNGENDPAAVTREERRHMNSVRFWFGRAPKAGEWNLVTRMLEKYERSLTIYERLLGFQWGGEKLAERPDIEEIAARSAVASRGPWKVDRDENVGENWLIVSLGDGVIVTTDHVRASEVGGSVAADSEFIAASRSDIPALIAYALRLETELAEARHTLGELPPPARAPDDGAANG